MIKVGFIDYYLNNWHANNYPEMLKNASDGEIQVAYCYGEVNCPYENMSSEEWSKKHNITLCATIEEVIEKSDVLCVLSPNNPEMHERLCKLPLASGKTTYVDKTFAPDLETAQRIFKRAKEYKTPLMTSSALRFAQEYQDIDASRVTSVVSFGGGEAAVYIIHQIEPLVMLFGTEFTRVINTGSSENPIITVEYKDGKRNVMCCCNAGAPFHMVFNYNDKKQRNVPVTSPFFNDFIKNLVEYYKTGVPAVEEKQTLGVIALRDACIQAINEPDKWFNIKEIAV